MEEEQRSPLLKFRATAKYDDDLGQWSQVGLALREDGSVEVYADFIYADKIYDEESQCVDIESGNRSFFFKMVRNSMEVEDGTDPTDMDEKEDFKYMRVNKRWKNRIGQGTIQLEETIDTWDEVIHERVSPFVKLFVDIRSISTFIIVAHRNLLSLYDMGDLDTIGDEGE